MILYYVFIIFVIIFYNDESLGKKRINIDGVFYECKSPKNSFERTRGVRTRICILKKDDELIQDKTEKKKLINENY